MTGSIAKKPELSDTKVKKALKELGIEPAAKKGVCNYCSADVIDEIKPAFGSARH